MHTNVDLKSQPVLSNYDIVIPRIFASNKWKQAIERLGLMVVFYGIDLKKFSNNASLDQGGAYIAIGLTNKENPCIPERLPYGWPLLGFLLNCLKPWRWSAEGKHTVIILESNIHLNISDYALGSHVTATASPADLRRLVKPSHTPGDYYVESAMLCGATNEQDQFTCIWLEESILFIPILWGKKGSRHFYSCDDDCHCALEDRLKAVKEWCDGQSAEYAGIEDLPPLVFEGTAPECSDQHIVGDVEADASLIGPRTKKYIPPEIQQNIAEYLDPTSLLTAVRAGVHVDSKTLRHAHSWTTLLDAECSVLGRLTKDRGNVFLMGAGVEYLYYGLSKTPENAPSPLPLLLSWTSEVNLELNPRRFNRVGTTMVRRPTILIHLQAIPPPDHTITVVTDLGYYIKKESTENKELTIPVLYFRDALWKLHHISVEHGKVKVGYGIKDRDKYCFEVGGTRFCLLD